MFKKPGPPAKYNPFKKRSTAYVNRIQSGYNNWAAIRQKVMHLANGRCQALRKGKPCGKPADHVHHLVPAAQGGRATISNLIAICHECHCRMPGHEHLRRTK